MARRIGENVVRGEIDNRLPGIIRGEIYLEGLNEPIYLELEGNCYPDLAGRQLQFTNLAPRAGQNLETLSRVQCGTAGEMSADRMVRIPTVSGEEVDRCLQERRPIPTCWSQSLYLEWFSGNGRVLIEGACFQCQLSRPKWRLSQEEHLWKLHLEEEKLDDLMADDDDDEEEARPEVALSESSKAAQAPLLNIDLVDGKHPHPLVQRTASFLLRTILESKKQKFYVDSAIQNQPLENMLEATVKATVRLANAIAKATDGPLRCEAKEIMQGLQRARWSLREAMENAGLAKHMGSADPQWLDSVYREFAEFRDEIRRLVQSYQEEIQAPSTPSQLKPSETPS